jgi:molecular chaperone GrpE
MLDPFSMPPTEQEQPPESPENAETPAAQDPSAALAAAKKEAADNYDRYLRAVADLENFRRRTVREKDELRQFSAAGILGDLIPVLDSLALALEAARKPGADLTSLADGVDRVLKQFKTALAGQGFAEINPVGLPFDPHQHEAISHQPSPDVQDGNIASVVRTGFSLNGRLLRPASVIVSSGAARKR